MNKRAIIKKIITRLTDDFSAFCRAAEASRAEATHEQSKAESKYDTRGLEASYLARGQSRQVQELEAAIEEFEKLPPRPFAPGDPIELGALVELELNGERHVYFVGPRAGGTEVQHLNREVLVITPQSPLGSQLLGKKQGDRLQLSLGGASNQYHVRSVT